MKYIFVSYLFALFFGCVPVKKYNELLAKEQAANSELAKYKPSALDFEARNTELNFQVTNLKRQVELLKADTLRLGRDNIMLQGNYDKANQEITLLETQLTKNQLLGAKDTKGLQKDLEARNNELQRKADALLETEKELQVKQKELLDREKRVQELEEAIERRDESMLALKNRLGTALLGFVSKGLTVVQKDGKIYLSLEAKLLFQPGSIVVEQGGIDALMQVSKVLESEKDMQIIVEGHTDVDVLKSPNHPKNNWELSVLRATSVVEIMLKNSKVDPKQLSASGRAEYNPIDAKDKAKNRRIEIIITPKLDELYSILNK